jgi:rubrerythrin
MISRNREGLFMEDKTVKTILEMAIEKEREAHEFYMDLYNLVSDTVAKDALIFLAGEETKHEEFLRGYLQGAYGADALPLDEVVDYEIAQYLEMPDIKKGMEAKDVYLVAAHRELNSYNFYQNLAHIHPDGEVKELFLKMANQELKHKEKVEYLYSNTAFPQTAGG